MGSPSLSWILTNVQASLGRGSSLKEPTEKVSLALRPLAGVEVVPWHSSYVTPAPHLVPRNTEFKLFRNQYTVGNMAGELNVTNDTFCKLKYHFHNLTKLFQMESYFSTWFIWCWNKPIQNCYDVYSSPSRFFVHSILTDITEGILTKFISHFLPCRFWIFNFFRLYYLCK